MAEREVQEIAMKHFLVCLKYLRISQRKSRISRRHAWKYASIPLKSLAGGYK
jgi:hypothetical protein